MKIKSTKLLLGGVITSVGLILSSLALASHHSGTLFSGLVANDEYVITLNYNNGGTGFSGAYSSTETSNNLAKTGSGYTITTSYKNAKASASNYVDLAGTGNSSGSGYVYNTTAITGITSVNVTFTGSLALYLSETSLFGQTGTAITSGTTYNLDGADNYFKVQNTGSNATQISQIRIAYSCTAGTRYYEKVTSGTITTGQYLIVYEAGNLAMDGSATEFGNCEIGEEVTIDNNKITAASADAYSFAIDATAKTIKSRSGYYIGRDTDSNGTDFSSTKADTHGEISVSDGIATIAGSSGAQLRYNTSASKFRYYKTTSYSSQQAVALYKRGGMGMLDSGSGSGSGGGSNPSTPTTGTYSVTITSSNCGLTTSESTSEQTKSYQLSDNATSITVKWGTGVKKDTSHNEVFINKNSFLQSNSDLVVKKITVDYYGNYLNHVVTADSNTITGNPSATSGTGTVLDYDINSSTWKISTTSYSQYFYFIKIYCEISSAPEEPVSVTGISLNTTAIQLAEGSSHSLVPTITPNNATDQEITYTSSNTGVATVDSSGLITAVSAGTATITATTHDGGYTAQCAVTVTAAKHVTSVSLNKTSTTIVRTNSETLVATVLPVDASNKAVTWTSSNTSVATVSSTGSVTAVAVGTSTITVTTNDGGLTAQCTVTVTPIAVSTISLDKEVLNLKVGQSDTLTATINPSTADNKTVTWTSSDTSIATVSGNGLTATVTAAGADGDKTATITATTQDGNHSASCVVSTSFSSEPVAGAKLDLVKNVNDLNDGDYIVIGCAENSAAAGDLSGSYLASINATISNEQLTYSDDMLPLLVGKSNSKFIFENDGEYLGWSNANLTFGESATEWTVSISSSGTVTMSGGSNTMKYNPSSPRFKLYGSSSVGMATVELYKFKGKVTGVSLDASDIGVNVGNTYTLHATVSPTDAVNKNVSWSSSNTSVATVNTEGVVTALTAGNTTITVTTQDGSYTATCLIRVMTGSTIVAKSITLNTTSGDVEVGGTLSLTATIAPENVTNKTITWTSSNTSVATVNSSGVVTGVAEGEATITAKTSNNLSATCNVTVVDDLLDAWTIMIYMCGADLERKSGYATADITEILSVAGQPNNVNIIIETGGANSWKSTYGIDASKLSRYHVRNGELVLDSKETYAAMGSQSTFESFLHWGLTEYPAAKTGVILWNHGGAMSGVCFDETEIGADDPLLNSETSAAFANQIGGSNKLEFIGYDACLMQMGDIAYRNSNYFNYMIAAQESEAGEGWDYDTWVDDLYAGEDTETILSATCDGFVQSYEDKWGSKYANDQTLSLLDLSKIGDYFDAIEDLASGVGSGINSYGKKNFRTWASRNVKCFGTEYCDDDDLAEYGITTDPADEDYYENYGFYYEDGYYIYAGSHSYGSFDAYDFLTKIGGLSQFSSLSTKIKTAKDAIEAVVIHNAIGDEAGECHGICLFYSTWVSTEQSKYYTSAETDFTQWRTMNNTYGAYK